MRKSVRYNIIKHKKEGQTLDYPKITEFVFISCCFGIGSVSFYFLYSKIINGRYIKMSKRKANVLATYGGPLQYHKLKDLFQMCVND